MTCMEVWGGNASADRFVSMAGLDAWVYAQPYQNSEGGGDVYYVSSCATGRITRLLVADVSGHGLAVAQTADALRKLMRKYINFIDQTRFVRSMNERFVELSEGGTFATAVVATFFAPTCHITLCNAGHPPPLAFRAKSRQWSLLRGEDNDAESADLPLGILDLVDYRLFEMKLGVGDFVLCYTDSLAESKDETGEFLGAAGLLRIAESLDVSDPARIVPQLLEKIRSLHSGNLDADDVTVMMFRPNGTAMDNPISLRLLAPFRIARSLLKDHIFARPDFKLANVGGALIPALNRLWGK